MLSRRTIWLLGVFGFACPAAFGLGAAAAEPRPNILWLVSEDNHTYLGCYGDRLARTPTIDRLAREGVLYERCFTQPVCAPSRFTLISGVYSASCGPAQHMRAQGKIPAWLKGFPAYLRAAGYYTTNNAKTDYNAPIDIREAWNECGRKAHWRNRKAGQPFFSVFNHEVTHESCLFPVEPRERPEPATDPAKVRVPPYQPDTPAIRTDWARYYDQMALLDRQLAAKLEDLKAAGLEGETIVFYYSDNGGVLPRSKRFLQETGIHVPLVVYYPPKWRHLAPAAPGGRIDDPVHFVDFAPTVLSLAGVKIPAYMQGRAFAGPSKGRANDYVLCTRDRMDERYDLMRAVVDRRFLYIHNFRPDLPYVQPLEYMFRARGYQSWAEEAAAGRLTPATAQFWGAKPTEELYDLAADHDSVKNLAGDPAHAATLARMRAAMAERVGTIHDNGFLPEGSAAEGFEASRRAGAYPVERIFAVARLAAQRDPGNLPKLIEALGDANEAVRWWGAQGCTMLRRGAIPAEAALRGRLEDSSGAVQVAAAEALAAIGKPELALPVLQRWLERTDNAAFALQAGNVLDRMGPEARPALPVIKRVLAVQPQRDTKGGQYPRRILQRIVEVLEGRAAALVYPGEAKK